MLNRFLYYYVSMRRVGLSIDLACVHYQIPMLSFCSSSTIQNFGASATVVIRSCRLPSTQDYTSHYLDCIWDKAVAVRSIGEVIAFAICYMGFVRNITLPLITSFMITSVLPACHKPKGFGCATHWDIVARTANPIADVLLQQLT